MPDTYTGNLNLVMPELGASADTWGEKLNENMRTIDQVIGAMETRLARADDSSPTGQLAFFALSDKTVDQLRNPQNANDLVVKPGWVICRGRSIGTGSFWTGESANRADFARLYDHLKAEGSPYGEDDNGNPRLPQGDGYFIRAVDLGSGVDPSGTRELGATQQDGFKNHTHPASSSSAGDHNHSGTTSTDTHNHIGQTDGAGNHRHRTTPSVDRAGQNIEFGYWTTSGGNRGDGDAGARTYTDYQGHHAHSFTTNNDSHSHTFTTSRTGAHSHPVSVEATGISETRVKNVCFYLCIRA